MKKLLASLLTLTLILGVGCTSTNDTDSDMETAEISDPALDTEGYASLDDEFSDDEFSKDDFAGDEEVIADFDEDLPSDALEPEFTGAEGEEVSLLDSPAEDYHVVTDDSETEFTSTDSLYTGDDLASNSYESSSLDNSSYGESYATETPEAKPNIPLQKVRDTPYYQDGVLLNAVYVGRKGDTVSSVSNKLFGQDKSSELKKANPFLSRREVKVGDKIYYNSPQRPQDAERMLTYYEDNGVPAQTYVSQSGENIRALSTTLLGHADSWKEVWATNYGVESKWDLPQGVELRYWPEGGVVASAPAPVATPETPAFPAEEVALEEPAPFQGDVAQNDFPMDDDFSLQDDFGMAGTTAALEPPPPPPPPPPAPSKQVASDADKDMTFMLSAAGLLLVGVGVILAVIRKSRARKLSMNTTTQI